MRAHGRVLRGRHTNETLLEAVALWCDDRAAALARYGPIGEWDTGGVTDMRDLFAGKGGFNDDIGGWDVSNVRDMHNMFLNAVAFNQPLHTWKVSK